MNDIVDGLQTVGVGGATTIVPSLVTELSEVVVIGEEIV